MPVAPITRGLVAAALVGCAIGGRRSPPAAERAGAERAVRVARARWNTALAARDTATLRALAADSIVQTSPGFTLVGREPYVTLVARLMTRRARFTMVYRPERVDVRAGAGGGELATEFGRWRETWLEGGEPTALEGTYYGIWRRRDGRWELAREAFAQLTCEGSRYCAR